MFKLICDEDLPLIRSWRNEEKVRQVMFSGHVIDASEHMVWWEKISKDKTQKWLLYYYQGKKAGVVCFTCLNQTDVNWGFYFANDVVTKKQQYQRWENLEKEAIEFSFNTLNANSLMAKVFSFNKPVIKMHQRFGFKIIGIELREKEQKMQEVVVMQLNIEND